MENFKIYNEDCFQTFARLDDHSIDLVLVDPPYQQTRLKWDSMIPLEPMWKELNRITKPNAAICIMGCQPFSSMLVMSNIKNFKYTIYWDKVNRITNFLNSKKQPLKKIEEIFLFYKKQPTYNPQMTEGKPYTATSTGNKTKCYNSQKDGIVTVSDGKRYPTNLISIPADSRSSVGRLHPTQKPVALMEWLISTYSNPNDVVMDFCMGVGTTGVAAGNLGRKFIGCDNNENYFKIADRRIVEAYSIS